jgi:hypothetical protein
LSPTGAYLWKLLDGEHTLDGLLAEIRRYFDKVPEEAADHIRTFVDALVAEGLAGLGGTGFGLLENTAMTGLRSQEYSDAPLGGVSVIGPFTYEPPTLVDFTAGQQARGTTCSGHGSHGGSCGSGAGAITCCYSGTCGADPGNCSCSGGGCGYYDNGTCNCYGTCVGSDCNSGGDGGIFCHTGGCAMYHVCNNGSGLQ